MLTRSAPVALAFLATIALPAIAHAQTAPTHPVNYHVVRQIALGGSGSWDYVAVDTARSRIFIAREDRVMVVDPVAGRVIGEIGGMHRAHGVAFAYAAGHGFATSGADSTVTMFDLATLKPLGTTIAAVDDDAILFDPASGDIFTLNGDAGSATVIDAKTGKRIATIPLGGKPEFGVSDGHGKVYVNINDKSEIAEIDVHARRVVRRWSIKPCEDPSGLAIDVAHHRLFSGCGNKVMAISDAAAGKLLSTEPIGSGVDANAYDAATGNAFASNGDGTLTVVHEDSPSSFRVAQTVQTMRGARTMGLDPRSHTVYTVSARFGPAPAAATPTNPRRRPPVLPGSFTLLVLQQ